MELSLMYRMRNESILDTNHLLLFFREIDATLIWSNQSNGLVRDNLSKKKSSSSFSQRLVFSFAFIKQKDHSILELAMIT